jgi:hypothetical protein
MTVSSAGRRSTCTGTAEAKRRTAEGWLFWFARGAKRSAAGKKAGRGRCRETIGAISPLPLGDTVHRQRPHTCVTDPYKRKNDGEQDAFMRDRMLAKRDCR